MPAERPVWPRGLHGRGPADARAPKFPVEICKHNADLGLPMHAAVVLTCPGEDVPLCSEVVKNACIPHLSGCHDKTPSSWPSTRLAR